MTRNADHGGILRHISQHHRTGADPAIPPHSNIAENFGPAADYHVFFDGGMPLAELLAGTTKRHALIQGNVVTHHRGLANDNPKSVINEQPSADLCPGMDFDSSKEACPLTQPSGKK